MKQIEAKLKVLAIVQKHGGLTIKTNGKLVQILDASGKEICFGYSWSKVLRELENDQ